MNRVDLLEKIEAHQIMLLKYMCDVGGSAKKQDIADYLQTGIYFVTRLIENLSHLASKSNGDFSITLDKTIVHFETKTDYSVNKLFLEFITQAPKYKILEELFLTGTTEPSRLCEKINISYSTYFRKIQELNNLLSEFKLTIKNGTIQGEELQIRYFFTSLYSEICSDYPTLLNNSDPKIQVIITSITEKIEAPLTEISKQKLLLYFIILKKRYVQNRNATFKITYVESNFLIQLKKTHFYLDIQKLLSSFFNYYSFKYHTDEALLLTLFLLGENIFPINSSILNNFKKIEHLSPLYRKTLIHYFFAFMKTKYPDKLLKPKQKDHLHHYLKSLVYKQSIFKGTMTRFHYNKEHPQVTFNATLQMFIDQYKLNYPQFFKHSISSPLILQQLSYAIDYYEQCIQSRITVGIFIEDDFLYSKFLTTWWISQVNLTTIGSAEEMVKSKSYDLVISNVDYPYIKNKGKKFLFITHQNEKMDLRDLKKVMTKMYLN